MRTIFFERKCSSLEVGASMAIELRRSSRRSQVALPAFSLAPLHSFLLPRSSSFYLIPSPQHISHVLINIATFLSLLLFIRLSLDFWTFLLRVPSSFDGSHQSGFGYRERTWSRTLQQGRKTEPPTYHLYPHPTRPKCS